MEGLFDLKTLATIVHVFGAILGAGGAFVSDGIFFQSIKDGRIERKEIEFLELGSKFVWIGLGILTVSGLFLVSTDVQGYLTSAKFLAKASIVLVIALNGFVFHLIHIPHIKKHEGIVFAQSPTFLKKSGVLAISGAISLISWITTVVLGSLRFIPYNYVQIIAVYCFFVFIVSVGALITKKKMMHL